MEPEEGVLGMYRLSWLRATPDTMPALLHQDLLEFIPEEYGLKADAGRSPAMRTSVCRPVCPWRRGPTLNEPCRRKDRRR